MKLISLKNTKKTLREAKNQAITMPDEPAYPWGLEVNLDASSIKKLKIDVKNINAGDTVHFLAEAKVTRVSQSENLDEVSGKTRSHDDLALQITSMNWGMPR